MDRQRLNDEYLNVDQQLRDLRTRHRNLHLNYGAYLTTEQRLLDLEQFDLRFARKIQTLEERLAQLIEIGATVVLGKI